VNERIFEVATGLFEVGEQERIWLVCRVRAPQLQ
jgi:hypothetical protein